MVKFRKAKINFTLSIFPFPFKKFQIQKICMELKPSHQDNPLWNAGYNFQQHQLLLQSVICSTFTALWSPTYLQRQPNRTQGHCWIGRWLRLGVWRRAAAGQQPHGHLHMVKCLQAQNRERSGKWQEAGWSPHCRAFFAAKAVWHCSLEQISAVLFLRGCNSLRNSPRTCRGHSSFSVLETCL